MSINQRFDTNTSAWQHQPRTRVEDPFPTSTLWWLIPGLIGFLLLSALFLYIEQRASLQMIFVAPSGALLSSRVDGGEGLDITFEGLDTAFFDTPQWSPDGRMIATIVRQSDQDSLFLIDAMQGTLLKRVEAATNEQLILAGQAWSHDSTRVLVLVSQSVEASITPRIIPIADDIDSVSIEDLAINQADRTPGWHPRDNRFILRVNTEAMTPTLHVVQSDGSNTVFAPDDGQDMRASATWSPNGRRIAYTAWQTEEYTQNQIFVANQDGSNPQPVVTDHINEWPFWSPDGRHLFFTHTAIDEEGNDSPPQLCRVAINGDAAMICIGENPRMDGLPNIDPRIFADWSPDHQKFFFQSYNPQTGRTTVYVSQTPDGSDPEVFSESSADFLAVYWAPTNRGLFINDLRQRETLLHWIDQERSPIAFPNGQYLSIQPTAARALLP